MGDVRLRLNELLGWQVATKDGAYGSILDEGHLDAEADDDREDEGHDEELEGAQAPEGAGWAVEDENEQDVDDGDGAARYEGDLRDEEVDGYCCADDLGWVSMLCRVSECDSEGWVVSNPYLSNIRSNNLCIHPSALLTSHNKTESLTAASAST
jgi:hypothetical protein